MLGLGWVDSLTTRSSSSLSCVGSGPILRAGSHCGHFGHMASCSRPKNTTPPTKRYANPDHGQPQQQEGKKRSWPVVREPRMNQERTLTTGAAGSSSDFLRKPNQELPLLAPRAVPNIIAEATTNTAENFILVRVVKAVVLVLVEERETRNAVRDREKDGQSVGRSID